ncbi:MAG: MBL fold metallo-hydrolase [Opitutales bacterium]|jgi:metallo-beta-lactamase family protein
MTRLSFLGAAGTVTGSRHLLETRDKRLLIDCGMFQGTKANRLKNWEQFQVDPASIDAVMLTHAHVDHIGYLPRLVKDGFRGPIHCTDATADLARILLLDTAHLQEEEAKWANKRGYTKHHPAEPLFCRQDAERVLPLLAPIPYGTHFEPAPGVRAKFRDAGHILGASFLDLKTVQSRRERKIVFSGDVGRPTDALLRPPAQPYNVDYLIMESTYGDRLHEPHSPVEHIARAINEGLERGGSIVIPAFAVGRSQMLLYVLRELEEAGTIPAVPVYLDSPMAVEALEIHRRHIPDLNLDCRKKHLLGTHLFHPKKLHLSVTREDSQRINDVKSGAIIISASGMVAGGRILHHLYARLPDEKNTVLIIGYQAEGTRGRAIVDGRPTVRMFGEEVPIKAHVERIEGFSGHADYEELLAWLMGFNKRPERVFLVHGEGEASKALQARIRSTFKWDVSVPAEGDHVLLDF